VHIHSIYHYLSPSILLEIKKRNIPIVMTVHDFHLVSPNYLLFHSGKICEVSKPDNYHRAFFHKCINNSYIASFIEIAEKYFNDIFINEKKLIDLFLVPSVFAQDKLHEFGFPSDKISVLPFFVEPKYFKVNYQPGEYILYFGGLYEQKGLEFLLNVMERVNHIPCFIVGEGSERDKLQRLINNKKLDNVKLLGYQKDTKLIKLISLSRFTIMPSLWFEGFGLVNLEANACGKPVVAANIGAIPEVVKDGENGFLFEPGNIEDCTEKIQTLWNNTKLTVDMGKQARRRVEKYYNSTGHYNRLMRIYTRLLSKN